MKSTSRLIVLIVTLLSSAALRAQPVANPATEAVSRNGWLDRHEAYCAIAKKGGVDLLFLGDWTTDAWRNRGKAIWDERYAPLNAANFGLSNDKTENLLWRLRHGELDGIHPKVVVLMIGINNFGRDTTEQIAEGIAVIVAEIQQRSPTTKILLLGLFPRSEKPDGYGRAKIADINRIIAGLDDGKRVFFLDIGQAFLQPDGSISRDTMYDFVHPTSAGYQQWADAMQNKLTELLK